MEGIYPYSPRDHATARHPSMGEWYSIEKYEMPVDSLLARDEDVEELRRSLIDFYEERHVVHAEVSMEMVQQIRSDETIALVPALVALVVTFEGRFKPRVAH